MYARAKHEVSELCEDIKRNSAEYSNEAAEYEFEEQLKRQSEKQYLKYIGAKLVMLHAFRTAQLFEQAVFMFVRSGSKANPQYYLTDLNVGPASHSDRIWGIIINNIEEKMDVRMDKVLELSSEMEGKYAEVEATANCRKLEGFMNDLFEKERVELLGNCLTRNVPIKRKQSLLVERSRYERLLNGSLPDIKSGKIKPSEVSTETHRSTDKKRAIVLSKLSSTFRR